MDDIFKIETEVLSCHPHQDQSYNAAPWNDSIQQVKWKSRKVILHEESYLQNLNIGDTSVLNQIVNRSPCSVCGKSRKYFCYKCHVPLETTKNLIPLIKVLPCKIDVIKHPSEMDGKSSAIHAKIISPENVRIFTYPHIENYSLRDENVYLVFPGPQSVTLENLKITLSSVDMPKDIRFVFVDSTWAQCHQILQHENLRDLKRVRIDGKKTSFWRYQGGMSDNHLATIEAIYYVTSDFSSEVLGLERRGQYDNLLFLFKFMFEGLRLTYQNAC